MSLLLSAATATIFALSTSSDTTLTVPKGTRLSIDNFGGEIVVDTWAKSGVRVRAEHGSRTIVHLERSESVLEVESHSRHGAPGAVDYHITVPVWMAVDLSGVYTDIVVEGTEADVRAETVKGEVRITGGKGVVEAQSVEGSVTVSKASGRIELAAVNDDIEVREVYGELAIESVNGDVSVEKAQATQVEISTVNGTIEFAGEIRKDGHYSFSTHNGDIALVVPETADASISVSTYSGDFESSFQIPMKEARRGKEFNFTLGKGSAEISLESFQGTISLRRPGESSEVSEAKSNSHTKTTTKSKTKTKTSSSHEEEDEE